jgi:hypothetical protein
MLVITTVNIIALMVLLTIILRENRKQIISTARVLGFEAKEAFDFATVGIIMLDENFNTS